VRYRLLLATVLLAGLACAGTVSAASAPSLTPVVLPRDHGAHPGFQFEWWYTAGTVASGRSDYFWFATLWSGGGYLIAKVNLVDLRADRIVLSKEYLAHQALSAGQSAIDLAGYALSWKQGRWSIDAQVPGRGSLDLTLTPVQPYLLEAPQGIIRLGQQAATAYYSAPRVAATGTLLLNGRAHALAGRGWLDHQWGTFASHLAFFHWNWFACQFQNGSDLMLYQFITPSGKPLGVQAGTFASPHGVVTYPRRFTVLPLGPVIRPQGALEKYPLGWRLRVPSAHLDITLRARARHQYIANQLIPGFWEGAAAITSGSPGACIVESTRETAGAL
jgi:predicted secreted hydrolase